MSKNKFLIIDGNALLHRAWHAIPPLATKSGEVVNAVYGFAMILIKALKEIKPTYITVTFDRKEPTFRHLEYTEYKAKRIKQPDEFYLQFGHCKELLDAFGIMYIEKAGFEADDLIATLAKLSVQKDGTIENIILTGDMDTFQLINNNTKVYSLKKGITDLVVYDSDAIKERFDGLEPSQMLDYKALRGDPSDNIKGVAGIGEKTAISLIKEFGSIQNLYQKIEAGQADLKDRIKDKLLTNKESALQSLHLVKLIDDVEIDFDLEKTKLGRANKEQLVKLFHNLEFRSLLPRLTDFFGNTVQQSLFDKGIITEPKKNIDTYHLVEQKVVIDKFLNDLKKQKIFAFDTETTSVNSFQARLVGMSFCFEEKIAYYLPWRSLDENQKDKVKLILEDKKIKKVGHNIKYDWEIMLSENIELAGVEFDTMIAAYLLNPGTRSYSLDSLSFSEFGYQKIQTESLIGKGKNQITMDLVEVEKVSQYACEDADFTWRLYNRFKPQLLEFIQNELFAKVEIPLMSVLVEMERNGVKIDIQYLNDLSKEIHNNRDRITKKIYELAGEVFNIDSPLQIKKILFEKLEISSQRIRRGKTGLSTAASELEKMRNSHPIVSYILQYRELTKLANTYVDVLPTLINKATGRIHTSFNQTVAATGRLSSSNPNLQNIPIKTELGNQIRKSFIASEKYKIVAADYSQIELRVIASLANEKNMIEAFNSGVDIHTATAAQINKVAISDVTSEMRRKAKAVNFGVVYGISAQGLSEGAEISYGEAQDFIDRYFLAYPGIREYMDTTIALAKKIGYVETMFGRRRYLPDINSSIYQVRNAAERMAINMPVQGSAADIIKMAMIEVYDKLGAKDENIRMILQVHDELVFEVKEDKIAKYAELIREAMENVVKLKVPLTVDIEVGNNWGELKKI